MTPSQTIDNLTQVVVLSTSEGILGGSQIFNQSLCHYLETQGFEATLATANPEMYSCKTYKVDSIRKRTDRVWVAFKLALEIREIGCRAVVLDDLSGLWLAPIFRLFGFKVFSILHLQLKKRDKWGFGHNLVSFHLLRLSSRVLHHAFSVGNANVEIFPIPVEFIGNFVGVNFFSVPRRKQKKFDLGTVSRLSPEKNLGLLLHLVASLSRTSARAISCVIVGDGPDKEFLVQLAEQLDLSKNVTFLPWTPRSELPGVLDEIRCFAITSRHEGFPTTILESHARGLPALVTKTSGFCPSFVNGFGLPTGFVFDEDDLGSFSVLKSIHSMIDRHESYESFCISKAAKFSESIVLGRVSHRLKECIS